VGWGGRIGLAVVVGGLAGAAAAGGQAGRAIAAVVVVAAIGLAWWGVVRHRPPGRAWITTVAGFTLVGVAQVTHRVLYGEQPVPHVGPVELLFGAGYVTFAVGVVAMVRARGRGRWDGLGLDVAVTVAAASLLAFGLLVDLGDPPGDQQAMAVVFAAADVAFLSLFVRLGLAGGFGPAVRYLVAAAVAVFAADAIHAVGPGHGASDVLYLSSIACIALGARDRSMRDLVQPGHPVPDGPRRLWILMPALLTVPLTLAVHAARSEPPSGPAAALAAVVTGLVAVRLGQLLAATARTHEELRVLANRDPLTGLANRRALLDRLDAVAAAPTGQAAVLFVDLDRFKVINDSFGHDVGDRVLEITARRLQGAVRDRDLVARFAGDEFVIVCDDLTSGDEAQHVVQRISTGLAEPIHTDGHHLEVGASIGFVIVDGIRDADGLLAEADAAMYRAKTAAEPVHARVTGGDSGPDQLSV
jgi:diguanylate cyclase (GGDEF)-like protein